MKRFVTVILTVLMVCSTLTVSYGTEINYSDINTPKTIAEDVVVSGSTVETVGETEVNEDIVSNAEIADLHVTGELNTVDFPFVIDGVQYPTLSEAITASIGKSVEINVVGDYVLGYEDKYTLTSGTDISLISQVGATLYASEDMGRLFSVGSGASLTLGGNLGIVGDTWDGTDIEILVPVITVRRNGTLTLQDEIVIRGFGTQNQDQSLSGCVINNSGTATIKGGTITGNCGGSVVYNTATLNIEAESHVDISGNNFLNNWQQDGSASTNDISTLTTINLSGDMSIGDIVLTSTAATINVTDTLTNSGGGASATIVTRYDAADLHIQGDDLSNHLVVRAHEVIYNVSSEGTLDFANCQVYSQTTNSYSAILSGLLPQSLKDADTVGFFLSKEVTEQLDGDDYKVSLTDVGRSGLFGNQSDEIIQVSPVNLASIDGTKGSSADYVFGLVVQGMQPSDSLYWAPFYHKADGTEVIGAVSSTFIG